MIEFMISHSYLGDGCLLRNDTHYDTFPQSGNISVTFPIGLGIVSKYSIKFDQINSLRNSATFDLVGRIFFKFVFKNSIKFDQIRPQNRSNSTKNSAQVNKFVLDFF